MSDDKPSKPMMPDDRQDRLAAALRANLRRRKDQQRGRLDVPRRQDELPPDGDRDS